MKKRINPAWTEQTIDLLNKSKRKKTNLLIDDIISCLILFVIIICLMIANSQLSTELRYWHEQADLYRVAYERVCTQTRVPITSNFDSVIAKEGFPK